LTLLLLFLETLLQLLLLLKLLLLLLLLLLLHLLLLLGLVHRLLFSSVLPIPEVSAAARPAALDEGATVPARAWYIKVYND
jgi:hypothetical protein